MRLDILKAVEGKRYLFSDKEPISDKLFEPRQIYADNPAEVEGAYTVENGSVEVELKVFLNLKAACDNCLEETAFDISFSVDALFVKDPGDDDGTYPYIGYSVDLTPLILEEILFRLPTKVLCKNKCKGLCPVCGANRNRTDCGCVIPINDDNPFAKLKNIAGGANDGSTKK